MDGLTNDSHPVKLLTESGDCVSLESTCLMVAIDETGDELLSDPNNPIFGLGGCVILAHDYAHLIREPWQAMKEKHFQGKDSPLHATELHPTNMSDAQLCALVEFFSENDFSRVAALATKWTTKPSDIAPYHLIVPVLYKRVEKVISHPHLISSVALLKEASERTDVLAEKYFTYHFQISEGAKRKELPMRKFVVPKRIREPAIEVADFIIHRAARNARTRITTGKELDWRDYEAIFKQVDRKLVSYLEVKEVLDS